MPPAQDPPVWMNRLSAQGAFEIWAATVQYRDRAPWHLPPGTQVLSLDIRIMRGHVDVRLYFDDQAVLRTRLHRDGGKRRSIEIPFRTRYDLPVEFLRLYVVPMHRANSPSPKPTTARESPPAARTP